MFLAPSRSDLGESLLTITLLGVYLIEPAGKTPTAGAHRGANADDHQKNSMAHLDDNSVLDRGTTFCVGSWIFIADGSGGFNSRLIDQNTSEASEATRRQEIDNFADQLEEVGLSVSNNGTRTQPEFDTIRPKTLSELEKDLDKLLEIRKQETTVDRKIISYGCQQDINQVEQPVNIVSPTFKDYLKYLMKI